MGTPERVPIPLWAGSSRCNSTWTLQGQLNYFTYKKDNSKVSLTDGYAQVSMGVRL